MPMLVASLLTCLTAAAAARINAQLQARKGIQHVDVPPVRSASTSSKDGNVAANINGEMYISDGDYIKDIEVNDLRNRYLLTKGATQKMVNDSLCTLILHQHSGYTPVAFLKFLLSSGTVLLTLSIARPGPPSFASADLRCLI